MLDATRIAPKLYQGSFPTSVQALKVARVHVVVYCAKEIQPASYPLHDAGVDVLRCPLDDNGNEPTSSEWNHAVETARRVARRVRSGRRTLVTCAQGRNRSGLVMALALHMLTGISGRRAVRHIQKLRQDALTNQGFVRALERVR